MPENKPEQPVASLAEGRRRSAGLAERKERHRKERTTKVKLDLSEVKVEEKEAKKKDSKPGLVDKYLSVVKTRRPSLPAGVFESIGKATTKGEAKRLLREYLVKNNVV